MANKNPLNVFRLIHSRSKSYYLTHPWEWFKDLGYCLRDAYQRITRGYADTDWFDMDSHLLELLPAMLKELAAHSHSYPGCAPFDTPEKWSAWLNEMADNLISCREEEVEKANEYYEDYIASFDIDWGATKKSTDERGFCTLTWAEQPNYDEISKLYFARDKELAVAAQQRLEDTLTALGQHFFQLWD